MTLVAEATSTEAALAARIGDHTRRITGLKGEVELVAAGSLPNDGKVIADERSYG